MQRRSFLEKLMLKIQKAYFAQNIYYRIDEYYESKTNLLTEIAENYYKLHTQNYPDWQRLLLECKIEGIELNKEDIERYSSPFIQRKVLRKVVGTIKRFEAKIKNQNANRYQFSMIVDLKEVIQILPWILTLGGFLNALVISSTLSTEIWRLFDIQDYLSFGIDAVSNFIPILISFIVLMAGKYFAFVRKIDYCVYQNNSEQEIPKWFCVIEMIFGVFVCIVLFVRIEFFSIKDLRMFLLLGLLLLFEGILNYFTKKTLKRLGYEAVIIFLLYTSILTFFSFYLKINLPNKETNYVISLNDSIPHDYKYITTTSKYHVFIEGDFTILIPIENTKQIMFKSNLSIKRDHQSDKDGEIILDRDNT